MTHQNYSIIETRAKRASLHLDPASFAHGTDDDFQSIDSAHSSPSSNPHSPLSPAMHRPNSASSHSEETEGNKEPSSGPHRVHSTGISSKADKEKRKRSRVNPEQLVHLERFFSADRSPTAARRREISDLLGMQERQTQIWFQNRRAKAKLQDGKTKGQGGSTETPPDTPPELSTGFEVDLHNLIHEDEPVTIIPCTDLSVGTWRRIATTMGKHDLVAYVCDAKRCLTWFIHSEGYGFKMEIPFEIILDTEFTNAAPGSGLASFLLSQPPAFYLETVSSPRSDRSVVRGWKRCADWTEGQQASRVLRHDLIGSAVQLAHVLRNLHANTPNSDIRLHSPSYHSEPPLTPMELPQPPLAGLTGPGFPYRNEAVEVPRMHHGRKRSYSGPPMMTHAYNQDTFPTLSGYSRSVMLHPSSASSATFPTSSFTHLPPRPHTMQSSSNFVSHMYQEYSASDPGHSISHHTASSEEYDPAMNSHALSSRAFSNHHIPRTFYEDDARLAYQMDALRRQSASASLTATGYDSTPSPPTLNTHYHPQSGGMSGTHTPEALSSSTSLLSGLPGISYESDDDLRRQEDAQ